jgi:hypothetical protein
MRPTSPCTPYVALNVSSLAVMIASSDEVHLRTCAPLTRNPQFLHQLMSVVPLLLLSSQDVEEGTLNALNCEGTDIRTFPHACMSFATLNYMRVCRISGGLVRWWNRCVRGTL